MSIKLPVPMFAFTPTVTSDDHLLIVGYDGAVSRQKSAYKMPVTNITSSNHPKLNSGTYTEWTELTATNYWFTGLVPSSSPPVVVGGENKGDTSTADIKMYDNKSWKKIGSLSSARSSVAVAAFNNTAIIIIGGYTKGDTIANCESSSVIVVELRQAELFH